MFPASVPEQGINKIHASLRLDYLEKVLNGAANQPGQNQYKLTGHILPRTAWFADNGFVLACPKVPKKL
jgi:hypothetical protein